MKEESELLKLGDLIDIKHGYGFKGEYFTDKPTKNILLTPGNFRIGGGFTDNKKKFYDGPVDHEFILNPDDLIITMTDLSKNGDTLGYPAIVPKTKGNEIFLHNQRLGKVILKRNEKIHKKYLYYLLTTKNYQKTIVSSATGTTVKHTSPTRILEYEFLLPPIKTQQKIANILGSLDDKIELNRQMNQTLEAMARAIFKSWFVDFDPVYAKIEGRNYPLPPEIMDLFPDELEESELGLIPKRWRVGELGEYVEINNSSIGKNSQYDEIKYIDISSVQEGKIISPQIIDIKSAPSRAKRIVNHGDIIWSCVRPNRRSFALLLKPSKKTIVSTGFAVISPNELPFTFVYSIVSRKDFSDYLTINATGSAYPAVKPQIFEKYKFVFPNNKILNTFHEFTVDFFHKIKNNFDQIEALSSCRDLLLPKLISVEIEI